MRIMDFVGVTYLQLTKNCKFLGGIQKHSTQCAYTVHAHIYMRVLHNNTACVCCHDLLFVGVIACVNFQNFVRSVAVLTFLSYIHAHMNLHT